MAFTHIEGLDEIDNQILGYIHDQARMSYSDIAEKVGISRVSVKNRLEQLEKTGIIQGYYAKINPEKLPEGIQFILDIEAYPEQYELVKNRIASMKSFRQVYQMSGECRLTAIGFAPNQPSIHKFVDTLYSDMKGVKRVGCHVVLSTVKDVDGGVDYVRKDRDSARTGEQAAPNGDH